MWAIASVSAEFKSLEMREREGNTLSRNSFVILAVSEIYELKRSVS